MKTRSSASRIVPALLVAGAAAVPAATAVDLLKQAIPSATPTQNLGSSTSGSVPAAGSAVAGITAIPASPAASSGTPAAEISATASSGPSKEYVGTAEQNRYGTVQVTLVVSGGKITGVLVTAPMDVFTSANINRQAVPILRRETLQAQSANIDAVSGATYTSESYIGSLQAALTAAKL